MATVCMHNDLFFQAITAASELKSKAVDSDTKHSWGKDELKIIRDLKMRYFTPREIANLLCFPPHFGEHVIFVHLHSTFSCSL